MTLNSPPSRNPANNGTLTGMLRVVLTKFLQSVDDMLPATVIAYDRAGNRAQVQPMINVVTTDNQQVQRPQVASVPVFRFGGGGFFINFPLSPGDTGWIKANDRDISILKQTGAMSPPNTQRKHTFEDAMFFPDALFNAITIAGDDADNAVLQNYAGTVKIALAEAYMSLVAPAIGIGGIPNASAILDLQSTTKALILPRMTTSQKNAIVSPIEGMVVYDTTENGISSYNGSTWS